MDDGFLEDSTGSEVFRDDDDDDVDEDALLADEWRSEDDLLSASVFFLREMIFFSVTTIGVYLAGGSSDFRSWGKRRRKGWCVIEIGVGFV